jgi:single-stranded-DNA-specific exonuclease
MSTFVASPGLLPELSRPSSAPSRSFSRPPASPASVERVAKWDLSRRVSERDRALGREAGVSGVTACVLRSRGVETPHQISQFLRADYERHDAYLLPDMEKAVARLHSAITQSEPFIIFGDYDVDGVASTAMLQRSLERLGAKCTPWIPERSQGYGLSPAVVERAHGHGATLIVTVDNGVCAFEAAERARELGIELLITDHHEPQGERLPHAVAIVNPKRLDSRYPFREICGAAVAYKLVLAYLQAHSPRHADGFAERYSDLVALATIADCMPLEGENRALVREGLRRLAGTKKAGLRALIEVSRARVTGGTLSGSQVGFFMAPRLNAVGRFDRAQLALELLLCSDEAQSRLLASELERHNVQRQEVTAQMSRDVHELMGGCDLDKDHAVVLAREGWGHGFVGMMASRVVEKTGRPTIVLAIEDGVARGSGRSIDGFDLGCVIEATRGIITQGGGHSGACGLQLPADRVEEFREKVLECAASQLSKDDFVRVVRPDCVVEAGDLSSQLADDLAHLEPCGKGNPEPLLAVRGAKILDGRNMGEGGAHLKWKVQVGTRRFDAVWWRPGERANGFGLGKSVDLCFTPELNHWNGQTTLQLTIKDARLASA